MNKKESEIIEKWVRYTNPGKPLQGMINSKSSIETTPTGKYYVVKSKWKLINWWRKITKTERVEEEYTYKWKI
jgi:hypothetical protein